MRTQNQAEFELNLAIELVLFCMHYVLQRGEISYKIRLFTCLDESEYLVTLGNRLVEAE